MKINDLDIVIPIYRSKDILSKLLDALSKWIAEQSFTVRVIFVEDASNDGTFESLKKHLEKVDFKFLLLQHTKNQGQYTASASGFSYSNAEWIVTIDDDMQHDPFEINKLIATCEKDNADLVFGTYNEKSHSFLRNLGSKWIKLFFRLDGVNFDHVTSFRLMHQSVIQPFKLKRSKVLFLDERLIAFAHKTTAVAVEHKERLAGKSTYSFLGLMQLTFNILFFHSSLPLKWITRFGLLMSLVFTCFGFYFIYRKIMFDAPLGFTSLIVAIFFSTGLILLSLGIIGEYIRKIWIAQQGMDEVTVIAHHE